jgi:hypothetical protein
MDEWMKKDVDVQQKKFNIFFSLLMSVSYVQCKLGGDPACESIILFRLKNPRIFEIARPTGPWTD